MAVGVVFCCLGLGFINSEKAFLFLGFEELESLSSVCFESAPLSSLGEEVVRLLCLSGTWLKAGEV